MAAASRNPFAGQRLAALLVVIGVILAAAALAPIAFGGYARDGLERAMRDAVAQNPQMEWRLTEFERGAYRSRARSRLTVDLPQRERSVQLDLRHRITHGPRLDGVHLGRVVTTTALEGRAAAVAERLFGDREPVRAELTLPFVGASTLEVVSPPMAESSVALGDGRVSWRGLELTVAASDGGHFTVDGRAPGGSIDDPSGQLRFADLRIEGSFHRSVADVVTGEATFDLGRLEAGGGADGVTRIDGLTFGYAVTSDAGDLNAELEVRIDEAVGDRGTYSDVRYRITIGPVPADFVAVYTEAARAGRGTPQGNARALQKALEKVPLSEIAAAEPALRLETARARTPSGPVRASAVVELNAPPQKGRLSVFGLLPLVSAEGHVEGPRPFALDMTEGILRARAATGEGAPEPSDARLRRMAERQLGRLVERGWLREDDGRLTSDLTFERMSLRVNGRQVFAPGG